MEQPTSSLVQRIVDWFAAFDLGAVVQNILLFIVVLGVLVFIHELGHFLVAKWSRVRVHEFALGFGPALFKRRVGETLYAIRIIPLGGFVKMAGMEPTESLAEDADPTEDDARAFHRRPISHRFAIMAAGPVMNLLLAVVLHAIVISMVAVTVGDVTPDSPAHQAGMLPGDRFISVAGQRVVTLEHVLAGIQKSEGAPVRIVVEREGAAQVLIVEPRRLEPQGDPAIGIEVMMSIGEERRPVWESLTLGLQQTWTNIVALVQMLYLIVSGQVPPDLAGPVGIYQMTGAFAQSGSVAFLSFMAALSISLGVFNLLPIPVLDGGGIMLLAIEAVRGKPLSPEARGMAQLVGLSLLLLILVYATFQDISRFGSDKAEVGSVAPWEAPHNKPLELPDPQGVGAWRYS